MEHKNLRRPPRTFSLLSTSFLHPTGVERPSQSQINIPPVTAGQLLSYTMTARFGPRGPSDTNPSQEDSAEDLEVRDVDIYDFLPDESSQSPQREESDDGASFGPRTVTFTGEWRPRIRRSRPGEARLGLRRLQRPRRNSESEDAFRDFISPNYITYSDDMDSSEEDDNSHRYSPSAQDIQNLNDLFLVGGRRRPSRALDDPQNAPKVSRTPHNTPETQIPVSPDSPRRQASPATLARRLIAQPQRRSRGGIPPANNEPDAGASAQNQASNQINRTPSRIHSPRSSRAQQRRFDRYFS